MKWYGSTVKSTEQAIDAARDSPSRRSTRYEVSPTAGNVSRKNRFSTTAGSEVNSPRNFQASTLIGNPPLTFG